MYESFSMHGAMGDLAFGDLGYGDNYGILPLAVAAAPVLAVRALVRRRQRKKSTKIARIDAQLKALRRAGRWKNRKKIKQLKAKRKIAVIEMRNGLVKEQKAARVKRAKHIRAMVVSGQIQPQQMAQIEEQETAADAEEAAMIDAILNEELAEDAADQQAEAMGDLALSNEGEAEGESFVQKYKWPLLGAAAIGAYYFYSKK